MFRGGRTRSRAIVIIMLISTTTTWTSVIIWERHLIDHIDSVRVPFMDFVQTFCRLLWVRCMAEFERSECGDSESTCEKHPCGSLTGCTVQQTDLPATSLKHDPRYVTHCKNRSPIQSIVLLHPTITMLLFCMHDKRIYAESGESSYHPKMV